MNFTTALPLTKIRFPSTFCLPQYHCFSLSQRASSLHAQSYFIWRYRDIDDFINSYHVVSSPAASGVLICYDTKQLHCAVRHLPHISHSSDNGLTCTEAEAALNLRSFCFSVIMITQLPQISLFHNLIC